MGSIISVIYLLGPILGATIVHFLNYRAIFVFNAVVHVISFFISLFFLRNSIHHLEQKQIVCGLVDGMDKDEQFPICLKAKETKDESSWVFEYMQFWRSMPCN